MTSRRYGAEVDRDAIIAEIREAIEAADDSGVPTLRRIRRVSTRELSAADGRDVIGIADELVDVPGVPAWWAFELVHHHPEAMRHLDVPTLERLGRGLSAWYEVDPFGTYLAGPTWREGRIDDGSVHGWARSTDRWWRRTAVVATVALNNTARGGDVDAPRTLAVCEIVIDDRDDMVVKAVSWALRELAKKAPAEVRTCLASHGNRIAARIRREVGNKLKHGVKNPRRQSD